MKRMLLSFSILATSLHGASAATSADVWALLNNDFDTVLKFPEDKPLHYALSHEFAFTLGDRCPGLMPSNYQASQSLYGEIFFAFVMYREAAHMVYNAQNKGQYLD